MFCGSARAKSSPLPGVDFFAAQLSGLLGADLGVGGVDFTRIPPFLKLPFGTN